MSFYVNMLIPSQLEVIFIQIKPKDVRLFLKFFIILEHGTIYQNLLQSFLFESFDYQSQLQNGLYGDPPTTLS